MKKSHAPRWMHYDDLVHAGWLGYHRASERIDPAHPHRQRFLKMWIRGAMLNEVRLWYGAGRRELGVRIESLDMHTHNPRDLTREEIEAREQYEERGDLLMQSLLAHLPAKLGQALWLWCTQAVSYQDLAEQMGVSQSTASGYVRRAVAMIRNGLATNPCGIESRALQVTTMQLSELITQGATV